MDRNGSGAKLANGAVLQMYGPCNDSCSAKARSIEKRMSQAPSAFPPVYESITSASLSRHKPHAG